MELDINTGDYTFEDMIKGNVLYVDKTEYIWNLIRPAKGLYFLSRPRRFGKSLLLSTLKAIFEGKKKLFKGLALYDKPYKWKRYPIIHLSFADYTPMKNTLEKVDAYLRDKIAAVAESNSIKLPKNIDAATAFGKLIDKLYGKGKVVILIDEYDKPILSNISKENVSDILMCLKGFYSVLKDRNDEERLLFVTGVSKFSHVSLFSELNNLTDITLDADYAAMLGFTEAEVRRYFADRIIEAAKTHGVSVEELMRQILEWYDGYRFSEADVHVCNPVSVSTFFKKKFKFSNYWDSTGTPTFLLELMRKQAYDYEAALNRWYGESIFAAYELEKLDITGLLWQTGYLTIKDVKEDAFGMLYRLDFPDKEVQSTFTSRLIKSYAGTGLEDELMAQIRAFGQAINNDDLDGFMRVFQSFLANIDYKLHIPDE